MGDPLLVAWATEVDAFQLGTRLEAYAETRPVIEAFCHLGLNLPQEVTKMIVDEVKDSAYISKAHSWLQAQRCCKATCTSESHFTSQELHDEFSIGCKDTWGAEDDDAEERLWERGRECHEAVTNTYLTKFDSTRLSGQNDSFNLCQQVCK